RTEVRQGLVEAVERPSDLQGLKHLAQTLSQTRQGRAEGRSQSSKDWGQSFQHTTHRGAEGLSERSQPLKANLEASKTCSQPWHSSVGHVSKDLADRDHRHEQGLHDDLQRRGSASRTLHKANDRSVAISTLLCSLLQATKTFSHAAEQASATLGCSLHDVAQGSEQA